MVENLCGRHGFLNEIRTARVNDRGGTPIKLVAAQIFRQWVIADVLDIFLAVVAANPFQIRADFVLVQRGVDVNVEMPPDGVGSVHHGLLRRRHGGCGVAGFD